MYQVYLPLVAGPGLAADLVGTITHSPDQTTFNADEPVEFAVTITNRGTAASAPTWADLYLNPTVPPTAANLLWYMTCGTTPCWGITWQIPALAPGQQVTLRSTPADYAAPYTLWPGYFAVGTTDVYLYVDSWMPGDPLGVVHESDETNNRAELHGFSVTGVNPMPLIPSSPAALPARGAP